MWLVQNMEKGATPQRKLRSSDCNKSKTFSKRSHQDVIRGSLTDVQQPQSTTSAKTEPPAAPGGLRRCRSLAASGGDVFTDLDIPGSHRSRRSQLIPRARLVDKASFRDRCYLSTTESKSKSQSEETLRSGDTAASVPHGKPPHDILPSFPQLGPHTSLDSLDSNYGNKSTSRRRRLELRRDLGLSLPNYYPDFRYDTDVSLNTEVYSDTDYFDESSRSLPNYSYEYDSSLEDLEGTSTYNPIYKEAGSDSGQSTLNNLDGEAKDLREPPKQKVNPEPEVHPKTPKREKRRKDKSTTDKQQDNYITTITIENNHPPEVSIEVKKSKLFTKKSTITKRHSYIKEFLNTQSRKPLKKIFAKNISKAFCDKGCEKEDLQGEYTTYADNQYCSLPDVHASRYLHRCEKIDRKLRQFERKKGEESRFVVNIGEHMNIPSEEPEELEKSNSETSKERNIESPRSVTPKSEMSGDAQQEFEEKIGTIRSFWDKLINKSSDEQERDGSPTAPKDEDEMGDAKKSNGCKVVEVQSKVESVRKLFEGNGLVENHKKLFEDKKVLKRSTSNIYESESNFESLNPNIVEIIESTDVDSKITNGTPPNIPTTKKVTNLTKHNSLLKKAPDPEFDHVRYKVMKSDLFQRNLFANYDRESQFDGLIQYLQDYSFQELLIDNNIVIIEPIRTKVEYQEPKKMQKITQIIPKPVNSNVESKQQSLRRHFFYHPIRVNREVNDEELPNPDTVKQVRQFFEIGMKKSQSSKDLDKPSRKKTIRYRTVFTNFEQPASLEAKRDSIVSNVDSIEDNEKQYVSEDVLQKIRECGTCVTYYGGRVLNRDQEQLSPMTKAIMDEIKGTEQRNCNCAEEPEPYQGFKFRLIKSNSCSSRLELIGTDLPTRKVDTQNTIDEDVCVDENANVQEESPKIVAEEKKVIDGKETEEDKCDKDVNINYNDFRAYEKLRKNSTKFNDIEFENYEVLEN